MAFTKDPCDGSPMEKYTKGQRTCIQCLVHVCWIAVDVKAAQSRILWLGFIQSDNTRHQQDWIVTCDLVTPTGGQRRWALGKDRANSAIPSL